MGTTDLFVELIVIGIGGAIWLLLLIFSAFGYDWVPLEDMFSLAALIPFLSVVYMLGIVVDRLADAAFGKLWDAPLRRRVYAQEDEYLDDKRLIYIHPGRLGDLLEYGRSRLRICRGWTLNALLILISMDIFVWTRLTGDSLRLKLTLFGSLALALFALGNWFSWRQLSLANYHKIKRQSAFLRAVHSVGSAPQDTP
jgi:hypothetical protein